MAGVAQQAEVPGRGRWGVDAQHRCFGQPREAGAAHAGQVLKALPQRRVRHRVQIETVIEHRIQPLAKQAVELGLWIGGAIPHAGLRIQRVAAAVDVGFHIGAGAAVPAVADRSTRGFGQEQQEVALAFHAQEVHVKPAVELVPDVAEGVVAGHQQVVDALEQRVADHPGGLGRLADQALDHRGAVEVPEHRECCVAVGAIAVPDQRQIDFLRATEALPQAVVLGSQDLVFDAGQFAPRQQHRGVAAVVGRQPQGAGQACLQFRAGKPRAAVVTGVDEINPEPILDHVQRHLPPTDRPLDEVHDEELGLVQQEPVARVRRNRGKGQEGVGRLFDVVRRQGGHRIGRLQEPTAVLRHALRRQHIGHVRLGQQGLALGFQPVMNPLHARIVVGAAGGHGLHGLAGRRGGPDQAEVVALRVAFEHQMAEEQVLVQVAAHQLLLERAAVEEAFPVGHLACDGCGQRRLRHVGRSRGEPARDHVQFLGRQPGQAVGHAGQRLPTGVVVVFVQARAGLRTVEREVERAREHRLVGQGMGLLECQAAVEHAGGQVVLGRRRALVEHRIEALCAPLRGGLRIDEQACGRRFKQSGAVIDHRLAGAAGHGLPRAQLELAGCVITTVADDAAALQDRAHVLAVGHPAGRRHGRLVEPRGVSRAEPGVQSVLGQGGAAGDAGRSQGETGNAHGESRLPAGGMGR